MYRKKVVRYSFEMQAVPLLTPRTNLAKKRNKAGLDRFGLDLEPRAEH